MLLTNESGTTQSLAFSSCGRRIAFGSGHGHLSVYALYDVIDEHGAVQG